MVLSLEPARKFEPAAITNMESADIILFLMKIKNPPPGIVDAIQGAAAWFERSKIYGIRVETIKAPPTKFIYHSSDEDAVVIPDIKAPPLWTRMYEIETG
jgi:PelA/Pel-15E family pectate lyase